MKPIGKVRLLLFMAALVVALVLAACFWLSGPKEEVLPNPNGYDDFVSAGEMLPQEIHEDSASLEECRRFVTTNALALNKGREGLAKLCRVPTEYSETWLDHHTIQVLATKRLARGFCVKGHLAQLEKRPADAAADYMTAIQMGSRLAHGGVMIDGLIATACEGEGEHFLDADIEHLNAEQALKLVAELEQVETTQEPASRILEHENEWAAAQRRSFSGLRSYFKEMFDTRSLRPDRDAQSDFAQQYVTRLHWEVELKAKLAAHAFALDIKRSPTNWAELVPAYVKQVPDVSFSPGDTNKLKFEETNYVRLF